MKKFFALSTVVLFSILSTPALAQQTATVSGIVSDATGAVIPGVEVTATNRNTGIATVRVSGEGGSYTIPALQPGPYTIVASLPGFSDASIQVNLTPSQSFRFNFRMQVGGVATTVEVVSDADALLATTTSSVGDALPEREVFNLPLATRDVFDLLDTTAGLVRREGGDATNFAGTRVSAVNTTRDGLTVSDGRYLDWNGAYSATHSSPDLVEEVQVSVGTVDAEAGRGSSQVRLQTRSGTNEFHGALFWASNNSALNAQGWFQNLRGEEKDWTNRNQFGGRLGGPIVRNKAFFFILIDQQRYLTRNNVTGTVLTEQARRGIFRYFPGAQNNNYLTGAGRRSVDLLGNPVDWQSITGATGPVQSFDLFADVGDPYRGTGISNNPFIQETLRRMPVPNDFTVGDGLNTAGYRWVRRQSGIDNAAGTSQDTNRDQLNLRFDYQLTPKNKINFVTSREHNFNDSAQPTWPSGFKGESTRDPNITSMQWTATISPTVLNEFRFGRRISSWHGRDPYEVGCCFGSNGRLDNLSDSAKEAQEFIPQTGEYPYIPALSTLGGQTSPWLGVRGGSRSQTSPLYQFADNFSWVMGKHSFKAGWEGTWADSDGWNVGGLWPGATMGNGAFAIRGIQGAFPGLLSADATRAESLLNDLSGSVGSQVMAYIVNKADIGFEDILTTNQQNLNYHQDDWAVYFKDNWNMTSNLTLNWGIRYDAYGVPYEAKGLAPVSANGDLYGIGGPTKELTTIKLVGPRTPNPNDTIHKRDWNNFAPQLGFSYRVPWTNRTTVVRGGYGVSYSGAPTLLQLDFGVGRNPGKSFATSLVPTVYTALPGSTNPTAAQVQFPLPLTIEPFGTVPLTDRRVDFFGYTQTRTVPYIQNFNLSIETEVAPNTNLSVAWLGTKGSQLYGAREINEPEIFSNGILEAFNITRGGGNAPLFDNMFRGISFGAGTCGVINGTTCPASKALRQWTQTDDFFADGEAAGFAEFISQTNQGTGQYGGLLRRNGYPENFIVTNPQFDNVIEYGNPDNSSYHALQTQLTRRYSSGYSGQLTYTWSRSLGNAGTPNFRAREDQAAGTRDPRNRGLQKGLQTFHRTHQITANGTWELPFGPGRAFGANAPSFVHRIIEGWQLSSIFNWASGQPLTVFAAGGNSTDAGFSVNGLQTLSAEQPVNTPDLVGNFPKTVGKVNVGDGVVTFLDGYTRVAEPVTSYYGSNPDSLQAHADIWQIVDSSGNVVLRTPKPGTTGNLSTSWFEGPPTLRFDFALAKSIQLTEGTRFTLRIDAINALNTPQWGNPNTNMFSPNFGQITTATGARTFTFNARVDF